MEIISSTVCDLLTQCRPIWKSEVAPRSMAWTRGLEFGYGAGFTADPLSAVGVFVRLRYDRDGF